jgi:hypothetical protein
MDGRAVTLRSAPLTMDGRGDRHVYHDGEDFSVIVAPTRAA